MLFHSALRRELARSFGATLVVMTTIVMTMTLVRTLSQATRGVVNPREVMMVMGYTVIGYLPPLLALCLFIAIVATLSRMWRDSEMVIWFSSGRGLASLLVPLARFAWPIVLGVAAMALVVWPWANEQGNQLRERYVGRGDLERVAPGQFQESSNGTRVFFLDKDTPDNRSGRNIFISTVERGKETVTAARSGRVVTEGQSQFLLLSSGQRVEIQQSDRSVKITEFEDFGNRVGESRIGATRAPPTKALATPVLALAPTDANLGELAWRLGLALAAINFIAIGLIVSTVNPRAGRSGHLMLALFAFVVYFNLLNLGQNWIATGRVHFAVLLLALHGGVFALAIAVLARQHNAWSLRGWLRRRRVPAA